MLPGKLPVYVDGVVQYHYENGKLVYDRPPGALALRDPRVSPRNGAGCMGQIGNGTCPGATGQRLGNGPGRVDQRLNSFQRNDGPHSCISRTPRRGSVRPRDDIYGNEERSQQVQRTISHTIIDLVSSDSSCTSSSKREVQGVL